MKKKQLTYLALMALVLSVQTGRGQCAPEEAFDLPEVVVTATKTGMDIKDVPSAVQVITGEEIQARGAQTLKDALRLATGINLIRTASSPTREAISIRGFDSRFSLILIDGKRVASEIDQNYELDRISLENIDRIEIVRGPVSSLYGTEALGGVVNIITKKPLKQAVVLNVSGGILSGGKNGKDHYDFTYDSGPLGKTAFTVSGSYTNNGALYKSNSLTYAPFGARKNLNSSLDYQLSPAETLTFTASYAKEDTHEFIRPAAVRIDSWDHTERNEHSVAYSRKSDGGEVFLRYYQSVMDKNVDQNNTISGALANWVKAERTVQVFEARVTRPCGAGHILTVGGEYRPEKFRGTAVDTGEGYFIATHASGASKTGSTANLNYLAGYLQDQWTVSPKVLAVIALRYDDSNKFESNLSPKLGLTYRAAADTRIKLNIGQGFRSPTPNQLYQNSSTQLGNPDLKSEKSTSCDLSIEKDFGATTAKLSYFINKVTDMIDLVTVSGTVKRFQNINKATIQGVEAEITRPLSDKLSWSASYTYLDARDDGNGQKLPNRARHLLSSGLSYNDRDGLTASLRAEGYRDYLLSPGGEKSYTLVNLAFAKKLAPESRLIFGVDNIFNKKDDDVPLTGVYVHCGVQFTF